MFDSRWAEDLWGFYRDGDRAGRSDGIFFDGLPLPIDLPQQQLIDAQTRTIRQWACQGMNLKAYMQAPIKKLYCKNKVEPRFVKRLLSKIVEQDKVDDITLSGLIEMMAGKDLSSCRKITKVLDIFAPEVIGTAMKQVVKKVGLENIEIAVNPEDLNPVARKIAESFLVSLGIGTKLTQILAKSYRFFSWHTTTPSGLWFSSNWFPDSALTLGCLRSVLNPFNGGLQEAMNTFLTQKKETYTWSQKKELL